MADDFESMSIAQLNDAVWYPDAADLDQASHAWGRVAWTLEMVHTEIDRVHHRMGTDAPGGPGGAGDALWHGHARDAVGSSRVDLQACKLEYSIVSPK